MLETINGVSFRTDFKLDRDGRLNGSFFDYIINNDAYRASQEIRYDSLGRISTTGIYTKGPDGVSHTLFTSNLFYRDLPDFKTTQQVYSVNMTIGEGPSKFDWMNFYSYDKNGNITGIDDIKVNTATNTRVVKSNTYVQSYC